MQMLFQLDAAEGASSQAVEDAIATFWPNFDADPEGKEFANEAVRGVSAHRADIDRALQAASTHWRLERMPRVDRNVLRLSAWQLLYRTEIPKAVGGEGTARHQQDLLGGEARALCLGTRVGHASQHTT